MGQTAVLEQLCVIAYFCSKRLLCRKRKYPFDRHMQLLRTGSTLTFYGYIDRLLVFQVIPQRVDLVQYHDQVLVGLIAHGPHVMFPHFHIAARDAGIRTEQKQYRLGSGQHAQGQLGFVAQCVKPGCVKNDQSPFQQLVGETDQGVAPVGNFHMVRHLAVGPEIGVIGLVVKSEFNCALERHLLGLDDLVESLADLLWIGGVQLNLSPVYRLVLKIGNTAFLQARFDGQQPEIAARLVLIVEQLSWAHRGAAGFRGQQSSAVMGKEQGVDELGFSARKFGDKGDCQAVFAQCFDGFEDPQLLLGGGKIVLFKPGLEFLNGLNELRAPLRVGV